jgi:DNA-directed RNA polymerase specialized sigma24 family protein
MAVDPDFVEMVDRLRRRDQAAAESLFELVLPKLRRIVASRLAHLSLQNRIEPDDICQMVLANFFARVFDGQFVLQNPEDLAKLLAKLARNQVLDEARRLMAVRRGAGVGQAADPHEVLPHVASHEFTPSRIVAGHELLDAMYRRLRPDEKTLADLRAQGHDWQSIAETTGGSAEALRKKLARAYDRVIEELRLNGPPSR